MKPDFVQALFKDSNGYIEVREELNGSISRKFIKPKDFHKYIPPTNKNIYFGIYERLSRKNGRKENCTSTNVIWADFDKFESKMSTKQRVAAVKIILKDSDMPKPSIIINSGHGIHVYWLLNKRVGDIAEEVSKEVATTVNSDPSVAEKARVMRLPYTTNVKDKPVKCEIVEADYNLIYDIELFKERFEIEEQDKQLDEATQQQIDLGVTSDRPCITEILKGVSAGARNFSLGRLTKWLQLKGYTENYSMKVIKNWNKLNTPPIDEKKLIYDFKFYWHGDYKLLGCNIDKSEHQQTLLMFCNRPECNYSMSSISNITYNNMIKCNNRLINDFRNITGNELIIIAVLIQHSEGLTTSKLTEKLTSKLTNKPCMSMPTMINCLDSLRKRSFIIITEGNKRAGIENLYKYKPQGTYGLGYTLITYGSVVGAINKIISQTEFKLYCLLLKYAFGKGAAYPSTTTIAKELGIEQPNVVLYLNKLEQADFIKREKVFKKGVEITNYKLLI